jgi:hypothetical protein
MNIFLGVLLLVFCTTTGYVLSLKFTKRKNFFINFSFFNKRLENEIAFTQKTLVNILRDSVNLGEFEKCLLEYLEKKSFCVDSKLFNNDEIDFIKNYFETIGGSDKDSQIKYLDSAGKIIDDYLSLTSNEEKRYKTLYIKLGFLFGLMAFVIVL